MKRPDKQHHSQKNRQIRGRGKKHEDQEASGRQVRAVTIKTGRRRDGSRIGRNLAAVSIGFAMLFFAGYLVHQLYQIQIISYDIYAEKAASQHYMKVSEQPRRGQILDRNGIELAGTTYVYRIGVTPKDVRSLTLTISTDEIARSLAEFLQLDPAFVRDSLAQTDKVYVQLKKDTPRDQTESLREYLRQNNIGGVRIDAEPQRYYTNGQLASQVIGFTRYGLDNLEGQLGIELYYDSWLTGQPGYTYVETDNYGRGGLPFSVPTSLRAQDGHHVTLHLDINIQKIVQEELENAIKLYDITQGGVAIVMDPYTGAILAMADYPYFSSTDPTAQPATFTGEKWNDTDPATIEYLSASVWRNRAISDGYRPGSTMKTLTAAMALEEAASHEEEVLIDRPMQVMGETISCYHRPGHGESSVELAFWRSCNPIFAQLALRIGVDRFYEYVHAFGLLGLTGIDLPAESTGLIHAHPTELDMATFSYGESATITPLQLITSFATFANGGNLVRPSVVRSITDANGNVVRETKPETVRKVISETTAARIREMLRGVVLYGTGSAAYAEGYSIAGKTSTAEYVEGHSVTGQTTVSDEETDYTLSFASLAPVENPEIVTLVVLYKPDDRKLSSSTAARVNGQIVARTLEYMGIGREYSDMDVSRLSAQKAVPDMVGLTYAQARRELSSQGFLAQAGDPAMGDGTLVKQQWPEAGTMLHNKSLIYLYPVEDPDEELMVVPDFTGMNVHECIRSAADSGLNIRIIGNSLGLAVNQDPLPTFRLLQEQNRRLPQEEQPPAPSEHEDLPEETADADEPDTDADEEPAELVTRLKRGSVVSIWFETIEEFAGGHHDDEDNPEDTDDEQGEIAQPED